MSILFRGFDGEKVVYWYDTDVIPKGVSQIAKVGEFKDENIIVEHKRKIKEAKILEEEKYIKIFVGGYVSFFAKPKVSREVGCLVFNKKEIMKKNIVLRSVVSAIGDNSCVIIKLWNVKKRTFVAIGMNGEYEISSASDEPDAIVSANLLNCDNFDANDDGLYVLHMFARGDKEPVAIHYISELVCC